MTIYLSSFKRVGFRRSDIVPFLESAGIPITRALEAARKSAALSASAPRASKDWRVTLSRSPVLSLRDWCRVMIGEDPNTEPGRETSEFSRWFAIIKKAVGNCELENFTHKEGGGLVTYITPADFKKWCNEIAVEYPLPGRLPTLQDLDNAEAERLQIIEGASECELLRARCDELSACVGRTEAELAMERAETARMHADLLEVADRADTNGREADHLREHLTQLEASALRCLDPGHEYFCRALAAAVAVCEARPAPAVAQGKKEATVRGGIEQWLLTHRGEYGAEQLTDTEVTRIVDLVNWDRQSGRRGAGRKGD